MKEYKGFKYWQTSDRKWWIRYPSGFKTKLECTSEDCVTKIIDELTAQVEV